MRYTLLVLSIGCGSDQKLADDVEGGPSPTTGPPATTPPTTDTPSTSDPGPTDTATAPSTSGGTGGTTATGDDLCALAAALTLTLDPYQTAGDGRVVYCHSGSGNSWNYIETDISSCLPHLNHEYDVFPTTGCDS